MDSSSIFHITITYHRFAYDILYVQGNKVNNCLLIYFPPLKEREASACYDFVPAAVDPIALPKRIYIQCKIIYSDRKPL